MKTVKLGETTKILLKEGDKLFSQGDQGDSAYMIVYGHLDVLVDDKKKGRCAMESCLVSLLYC